MKSEKFKKLYSDALQALETKQPLSIAPDDLLVLIERSEKYGKVLSTTSEGYWLIDPTSKKTLEVNHALCSILGYSKEEIIGRTPLEFVDDTNRAIFIEQTGKIKTTNHRSYEIELQHSNGNNVPCLFHASTIKDENLKPIFAVAFVSDLSQIKKFENELISARKKADEANHTKSQFLASMSHELRTPMHAILSFTSLALKKINDEQKLTKFLNNIQTSGLRLTTLLNDLLDLSKLESGKIHLEFTEQDITQLFQKALTEVGSLLAEKNIHIEFDTDRHFECMLDNKTMMQVFVNLLSNAIKFSPQDSLIKIEIRKSSKKLGEKFQNIIRIALYDEGIGIPKEEIEHIFEKYVQSSNTKTQAKGTGLGLPITKEIIKLHKGKIWAESPPEGLTRGSVFYLELPVLQGIPNQVSFTNIQDAINSHLEWIKAIEEMLVSKQVSIEIPNSVISNDRHCSLGQWIYSEKVQGEHFDELKRTHQEFHLLAGECVAFCEVANYSRAEEKFSSLNKVSNKIIQLLKSFNFIVWSDLYSVGVKALDAQHKNLVEIINNLAASLASTSSSRAVDEIFDDLIKYAHEHLEYEEKLLAENNYPDFDNHRQMHIAYLEKFNELSRHAKSGDPQLIKEITGFLRDWWQHHILEEDMKYKSFFEQKAIR